MDNIKRIPDTTFNDVRTYVDKQFALGSERKGVPLFKKTPKNDAFVNQVIKLLRRTKDKVLWVIIPSHSIYPEISVNNKRLTKGLLVATATKLLVYKPERNLIDWIKGKSPEISVQVFNWNVDNILFEATLDGVALGTVSSWIRISLGNNYFRFAFQRASWGDGTIYNQKGEELKRWLYLLRLTFSAESPTIIKKLRQKRKEIEKERKKNVEKLFKSWVPDIWRDTTNTIVKTSAELWGSYDEILGRWNNKQMSLGFENDGEKYWIHVKYSDFIAIQNNEEFYSTINVPEEVENIRLFYYEKDWYCFQAEINFSDAVALVKASKIKENEKLQREIERARSIINGEERIRRRQRIPDSVKSFVWNRDGGKCVECGSKKKLEFDHIVPFSKGGSDTARNLQLLCEGCNRQKGNSID